MKRTSCLLLTLALMLTFLPTTARATVIDSGTCGDSVTWSLDDEGTLTIAGTGAMTDYDLDNYTDAPWYRMSDQIKAVAIQDGVTNVGSYAFNGYESIESIEIPNSVTRIGERTFYACHALTDVSLSANVSSIGERAFLSNRLSRIEVASDNPDYQSIDGDLYTKDGKTLLSIPAGKRGDYSAREGVTAIAGEAFHGCSYLTSITIPVGVSTIGAYAFSCCTVLESISIPESVTRIGYGAFYMCDSLTDVHYDGTVEQWNAITDGKKLTKATIHLKNGTIPGEAFSAMSQVLLNGNWNPGVRTQETNLGGLVADALKWYVGKKMGDSIDISPERLVAVTNGGGLRTSVAAGTVTQKNINAVMPFGNTLSIAFITGAKLLEALEAATQCLPIPAFPQTSGIQWTLNVAKSYDAKEETYPDSNYCGPQTINRVTIQSINGEAFDETAVYAVATNSFLAQGGDTYYVFRESRNTGVLMTEAVCSYISEVLGGTVTAEAYGAPAGRLTIIEENLDLPQLTTPTNLHWDEDYMFLGTNARPAYIPGMIDWEIVGGAQHDRMLVRLYQQSGDSWDLDSAWNLGWSTGDTEFSASLPFVVYNAGSGTYRFTVQALGDGTNYRNSAESAPSDTFTYVQPDAKLPTPQNLRWNRDVMLWDTVQDENVIGYYLRYDRRPVGSTDESEWRHCSDSSVFRADVGSCALRADERQAGYEYRFRVMAISRDITASCSSDFSGYSVSNTLTLYDPILSQLKESDDNATVVIKNAVSKGDVIEGSLEALVQKIEMKATVDATKASAAKDIVAGMTVIGAGMNAPDGATDVKLQVNEASSDFVASEQFDKAVRFSMDVIATVAGAPQNLTEGHKKLDVPVKLTLSVPRDIDPEKLVLLHKTEEGVVSLTPRITKGGSGYQASFEVDSFSDFALAEKKTLASARANTVSTTVNVQIAGGARVYFAVYDANGKMLGIAGGEKVDAGRNVTVSVACDSEKAASGKVFFLGDGFSLVGPAQNISIRQ